MEPIDFNRFKWRLDERTPSRYIREVAGAELGAHFWNYFCHGELAMFLGAYATLSQPISSNELFDYIRLAWIALRWEIPTIASQTIYELHEGNALPTTYLAYDLPPSSAEVQSWADATVSLRNDVKDLEELRFKIGQHSLPPSALTPSAYAYLVPISSTTFGILLNISHVPFDGNGAKILLTKLLDHVSHYITDSKYSVIQASNFKWGEEGGHLLPVAFDLLRKHEPEVKDGEGNIVQAGIPEEPTSGPLYGATFGDVIQKVVGGPAHAHPFKSVKEPPENTLPRPGYFRYTFSVEDSKKLASIKTFGPTNEKLTVNQLALAALGLLLILDNPSTTDPDALIFIFGIANCRYRLSPAYQSALAYPGSCLAMTPLQIPLSSVSSLLDSPKDLLFKLCELSREEYKAQAAYPALLGIAAQAIGGMMYFLANHPTHPWKGPGYSGDGIGQTYLKPTYPLHADKSAAVIEITEVFFSANRTEPGPYFRTSEWNGRIILTADFNEVGVERDVVDGWLKKWAELMLMAVN